MNAAVYQSTYVAVTYHVHSNIILDTFYSSKPAARYLLGILWRSRADLRHKLPIYSPSLTAIRIRIGLGK